MLLCIMSLYDMLEERCLILKLLSTFFTLKCFSVFIRPTLIEPYYLIEHLHNFLKKVICMYYLTDPV